MNPEFIMILVEEKDAIFHANHDDQRRDYSREDRDFIAKENDQSQGPDHTDHNDDHRE